MTLDISTKRTDQSPRKRREKYGDMIPLENLRWARIRWWDRAANGGKRGLIDLDVSRIVNMAIAGKISPEMQTVRAKDLFIEPGVKRTHVTLAMLEGGVALPGKLWIPVVRLPDGRFWAFDDQCSVACWQKDFPDAFIKVAVIPWP